MVEANRTSTRSGKRNPCPICDRTKDGDCATQPDGLIYCHRGTSNKPPDGLKPGDVHKGYAYLGESDLGRAMFKPDQPMDGNSRRPLPSGQIASQARQPVSQQPPAPAVGSVQLARLPAPLPPVSSPYSYGPTLRILRTEPQGDNPKSFWCEHLVDNRWVKGAGNDPWPVFAEQSALEAKGWILELEGEKCCGIAQKGGIVAITQPGCAHRIEQITARYQRLSAAGLDGVIFLSDNDPQGRKRARQSQEAAAAAGLAFVLLPAENVWPDLPKGGSIDDAPGTPAERIAAIEDSLTKTGESSAESSPKNDKKELRDPIGDAVRSAKTTTEQLRQGIAAIDDLPSPPERVVAFQRLKEATGLNHGKAFDLAVSALMDEQGSDQNCSMAELYQLPPVSDWVINGFGAGGGLVALGGDRGDGKTALLYRLAEAVASGSKAFGELQTMQAPVIICQTDESNVNAKRKARTMGIDSNLPIHWKWKFNPFMLPELRKTILETQAKLVCIDSITTVSAGRGIKPNDPEYSLFLYQLNHLAADLGICIVITIHLRKRDNSSTKPRTDLFLDDFLGTGMLTAAASDIWALWRDRQEGAFPFQFVFKCLGKRNCEDGARWDLQGNNDDLSFTFAGVQGGGDAPSQGLDAGNRAIAYLRHRPGEVYTAADIAIAIELKEQTIRKALRSIHSQGNISGLQRVPLERTEPGRPSYGWKF